MDKPDIRISQTEKQKRIMRVFELMTAGAFSFEIVQVIADQEGWNVGGRQIYNYIREADKLYEEIAKNRGKKLFGRQMARMEVLFKNSLKIQDYKTALAIIKEQNRILGF